MSNSGANLIGFKGNIGKYKPICQHNENVVEIVKKVYQGIIINSTNYT
jgi:hypothetical protein